MRAFKQWRRIGRGGAAEAAEALRRAVEDLKQINRVSEEGFLRILQSLEGRLGETRAISSECEAAVAALGESESGRVEEELQETLERTRAAQEEAGAGTQLLEESSRGVGNLEGRASRLAPSVRTFHVLGVCTRIERERLGEIGADFEGLSAEVSRLATDLGEKADAIADTCASVRLLIADAVAAASRMESRRRSELPKILEACSASLNGLSWRRNQAAEHSRQMASGFQSVSGEMGKLVSALQYHDITRQRIEHVVEALEQASEKRGRGAADAMAALARLQSAQLTSAMDEFGGAVGRICGGLRRMSGDILAMADGASAQLREQAGDAGSLERLEQAFESVARAVADYGASSAALRKTEAGVIESLRPVSEFAGALESIGLRIQLAAINASVKAAHLGGEGAALAALADAIQGTAAESALAGSSVLEALAGVLDCASRLEQEAGRAERSQQEVGIARSLREVMASLQHAASNSGARIAAVEQKARALSERISAVADDMERDERFALAVGSAIEALDGLAGTGTEAGGKHLERLRRLYTMESERALHDSLVAPSSPAAAEPVMGPPAVLAGATAGSGDEDLGENVELF